MADAPPFLRFEQSHSRYCSRINACPTYHDHGRTLANAISIWLALHDLGQHSQERARLEQRLASVLLCARGGASSSSTAAAASSPVPTAAAATNGNGKDGNGSSHAVPGEPTAAPAPAAPQQPAGQAQAQKPRPYEGEGAGKTEEVLVPVADDAAVAEALEAIAKADVRQFDLLGDLVRVGVLLLA